MESQKGGELLANPQAALCFHWKSERRQGKFTSTSQSKRGPKREVSELEEENQELRHERDSYKLKYEQAQKLIEAQKKIAELFETAAREEAPPKTRRDKS